MGWLIAAVILILLAMIPLGVSASYNASGASLKIVAGPFRFLLYPKRKAPPKEKEPEKADDISAPAIEKKPAAKSVQNQETVQDKQTVHEKQTGGSWKDFLPLARIALDFLNQFRRKLRVNSLKLKVVLAGEDPCDLALNYGRAWAAVSDLLTLADQVFVIQKRNIQIESDFTAEKILVTADLKLTITLSRLLSLLTVFGVKGLRAFFAMQKKRKAVS